MSSYSKSDGADLSRIPAFLFAVVLLDADTRLRLRAEPALYESFVAEQADLLERAYRGGAAPAVVARSARSWHTALGDVAREPSAEHARLTGLVGQMLIAGGGDTETMATAETWLIAAIEELCAASVWNRKRIKLLAELVLNHAVTLKARRRVADATAVLRKTMSDHALKNHWALGDRLPLVRQEVIMAGGTNPHRWLARQHDEMRAAGPLEHYRTIKRLFEFSMNAGEVSASARLLPASVRAFGPIARSVPPLARISFVKNVGQYEALAGEVERGLVLLDTARRAAEQHRLRGQLRQIDGLATLIQAGERPLLQTYLAA